jgi:hypothetical protein
LLTNCIRLGDIAPDFTAETTDGEIDFHEWKDGSLGRAVQPPGRLHAGLHHRARPHRQALKASSTSAT